MADIKRKVKISDDKTITVKVPEEWDANQIKTELIQRGVIGNDPEVKRAMTAPKEKGEDVSSIPKEYIKHAREMKTVMGGTRKYTQRPTQPTESGVGFLYWSLEKLDRPRSAMVGGIISLLEQENPIPAIKRAFKGQEHALMGDYIFEKMSEEAKKPIHERNPLIMAPWISVAYEKYPAETLAAVSTIGGLFFDISLDPLTYTAIGATKKGKSAEVFFSLQKAGYDITDPKMAEYIRDLINKGELKEATRLSEKLLQDHQRMWVAGVPIPGVISGKIVGLTERLVEKIKATKAGDDAWRRFSTKHGLDEGLEGFADIEERFKNVAAMARYHSVKDNRELAKKMVELSKRTKVPYEEVHRIITNIGERGGVGAVRMANLSKDEIRLLDEVEVQNVISDLSEKNKFQLSLEQASGIRISELGSGDINNLQRLDEAIMFAANEGKTSAVNPLTGKIKSLAGLQADREVLAKQVARQERISYMRHALTPKAREIVSKQAGGKKRSASGGRVFSLQHASTLERRFKDMTIDEINTLARKGELPGYEGTKFPSGFFYDDPAVIQTLRDIHHRKSMALVEMLETTKDRFAISLDELRDKHGASLTSEELMAKEGIDGYRIINNPKLQALTKGHVYPEEIAYRLEQHYGAIFEPEMTDEFLRIYDGVQNWWKAYTLGIFPSYHFRNAIGNMWNNFVTGTNNPEVYFTALGIQSGKKGFILTADGRKISYDEIRQHMDELGVHNRGFMSTDIEQAIKTELGGARWVSLSKEAKAIRIGRAVGTSIENNARIAKFIDELQKGKSFFDASKSVKHALFDYQDLTNFEKTWMKRLAPFYTWSRKNIPLQLEQMIKNPGKYKAVDTLRMNVENTNRSPEDPNEYVLHDWMLTNYPTRIRWKEISNPETGKTHKMPEYFMLGGWLPAADVWKLGSTPGQLIVDNITPMIKVWAEPAFGVDWFTWNELDSDIKQDFLGMRLNQKQIKILKNLRILTTADAIAKNLGMYEKTPSLMPSPETEKTPEETLISFLTGIRTYTVDLEKNYIRKLREAGGKQAGETITGKIHKQMFVGTTDKEIKQLIEKLDKEQIKELENLIERSENRKKKNK